MGFSPLANMSRRIPDGGRFNERQSRVTGFGIHHNAGVDAYGEASNPNREVSANYWITNAGIIIPNVDESLRAFTSGMAGYPAGTAADHRNITVEVSNSPEGVRAKTWAISEAAELALSALIGDVYRRHGLGPVRRGAGQGVGIHQDWVPTSCPGPYIVQHLDRIIARAEVARVNGGLTAPSKEDEDMIDSMFAVVDKVPSWCWINWATGRVFAVHTQKEADWIAGYMGSIKTNWAGDKLGSDKYKNKLALLGILAPKVEVVALDDATHKRLQAMVNAGVQAAVAGAAAK